MAISAGMALVSTLSTGAMVGMGVTGATLMGGSMMSHFLISTAMGAALNALTPKPSIPDIPQNQANSGYQVSSRAAAANHQIIYGKTKVGGAIVYDDVSGVNNKVLHRVIAFTGHEIEEFTTFYFNNEALTLTTGTDSHSDTYYYPTVATSPSGATHDRYNDYVRIYFRKGGTENDTAIANLIAEGSGWTSDHKLRGVAYAYVRMAFDADAFPNGVPEMSCLIKGKKVYDPRTSTTAWSDNPALCIRDYLTSTTYGLGEAAASIDDDKVEIAADVCQYADYDVNDADPPSTKTGGNRFTLNGAFTTAVTPHDHLMDLLTAMGGVLWYGQGKWRMKAGHYVNPTISLTTDDLRSNVQVSTRHSRRDNFNTIKGVFRGPATNYQPTDYAEVTNQAFIDADGGQKSVYNLSLPFTDDFQIARHLALITLERNRQQLTVKATFGMKAFELQVGDVVNLTIDRFGFSSKTFEVIQWTFGLSGAELGVSLVLREISASVFDTISDGQVYERDNTNLLSPFEVPAVAIATSNQYGGVFKVVSEKLLRELQLDVTTQDASRIDRVEVQYRPASTGDYLNIGTGGLGRYSVLDLDEGNYDARVRGINTFGVKGEYSYLLNFLLAPFDSPPSDVSSSSFVFEVSQGTIFLQWAAISDLDLSYYLIRYSSDLTTASLSAANTLWGGNSNVLVERVGRPATNISLPARSGTYLIKAYDKAGNPSDNVGYVLVPAAALPVLGNNITQTEHSTFGGNTGLTNSNIQVDTVPSPNELRIDDTSASTPSGTYYFGGALSGAQTASSADYIDVGTVRTVTTSGSVTFARYIDYSSVFDNIPQTWDTWPDTFDDWTNEDAGFGDFSTAIQVRATSDDPASSPTWGEWADALGQQVVGRGFQFRVNLDATNTEVSPKITELTGTIGY
jgi:hypothetical protein